MRIADLREFVRLCQTLNFTSTAKEFYISQSVLSKHISNMENELDVKLFARASSGVHLTDFGEQFLDGALDILRTYDQTVQNLHDMKQGFKTSIILGYLYGASSGFLLPAIQRFNRLYPSVSVELKACEFDEVIKLLIEDRIDIGITTLFNADWLLSCGQYRMHPLYEDGLAVIVPRSHRLADAKELSLEDLEGEQLITTATPFMARDASLIQSILKPVLDRLEVRHLLHDLTSMQLLMQNSGALFFTFAHIANAMDDIAVAIPLKEAAHVKFSVGVIWKETKTSKMMLDLVKSFESAVQKHPARKKTC